MTLFLPFAVSLILSLVLIPITMRLAKKYGYVDDPKKHKHPAVLHKKIIPRAGGLAIFGAVFLSALVFIPLTREVLAIFAGGLILVLAGIIDDRRDLGKWLKLLIQLLAALIVVGSGIGIAFITNPLSSVPILGALDVIHLDSMRVVFHFLGEHSILVFADIFAILWIIWVVNMVNFSTGVDGQMPGIVLVTLLVLFMVSLKLSGQDPSQILGTKLALAGAGATLGFLVFNFAPARIFPGDSGSYFLGYLVAVLAILSGAKVGTAVLVMAVPLIDGVFTILRRIADGQSPLLGDRGHLHHKLLELGWTQRQVALFYWLLCAILGAVALSLSSSGKLFAGIIIGIIILGGLLWLNMILPLKARK